MYFDVAVSVLQLLLLLQEMSAAADALALIPDAVAGGGCCYCS